MEHSIGNKMRKCMIDIRRDLWLYIMLFPAVVLVAIFHYAPMYGILISFKEYNVFKGFQGSAWVGFEIFSKLFGSETFRGALWNNVIIGVSKLLFGFPTPIILSLMINEIRSTKLKKTIQTSVILPNFISWIVINGILFSMFSIRNGAIPVTLRSLGVTNIRDVLADKKHFRTVILLTYLWKDGGYATIIYLSAITGIDQTLYEAASIDGAGRWQQLIHVTMASLMPTIIMLLIIRVGSIMNAGFDQVFNMYTETVYDVADIIDTYVYRLGLKNLQYSLSTAVGLFKSAIGLVLVVVVNYIVRKIGGKENALW